MKERAAVKLGSAGIDNLEFDGQAITDLATGKKITIKDLATTPCS